VLATSIEKAEKAKPPHFTVHTSQTNTEEGTEVDVPSWRREQIDAKVQRETAEHDQSDSRASEPGFPLSLRCALSFT
jgi:hypothetical protein